MRKAKLFSLVFVPVLVLSMFPIMAGDNKAKAVDDYPGYDDWGFVTYQCTSYAAWRVNRDAGTTTAPYFFKNDFDNNTNTGWNGTPNDFGDAGTWDEAAASFGFNVDNNPRVGDIAVWDANQGEAGEAGHVAYVESINANGTVNVSEYNWNGGDLSYNERTGLTANHYIHFNLKKPKADQDLNVVGDFNGDDREDLYAVYNYSSTTSTTTFVQTANAASNQGTPWQAKSPRTYQFNLSKCKYVDKANLNNDGKDDVLCVYDYGNNVTTTFAQLSNTSGTLNTWQPWSQQSSQFNLSKCKKFLVGQANSDSYNDLFCVYDYGNNVTGTWVQYSTGQGNATVWQSWAGQTSQFNLNNCRALAKVNINDDGRTDLACVYDYGNTATTTWVQLSNGDVGSLWQYFGDQTTAFNLSKCRIITFGRVNDDSTDDGLCVYDYGNNATTTFKQIITPTGATQWAEWSPQSTQFNLNKCTSLQPAQLNQDGKLDLICTYDYGNNTNRTWAQLSLSESGSAWQTFSNYTNQFNISKCKTIQVADVNADQSDDLLCIYDYGSNANTTWAQISSGNSSTAWQTWNTQTTGFNLDNCVNLKK